MQLVLRDEVGKNPDEVDESHIHRLGAEDLVEQKLHLGSELVVLEDLAVVELYLLLRVFLGLGRERVPRCRGRGKGREGS